MALQDDRICWMEAISASCSAAFKPAAPESQYVYEPVTPIAKSEMYSSDRISRSELKHHSQAKTRRARPLPMIEEFVPDLGNQTANLSPASTSQYVDETVSDDKEPIYDDIADSIAGSGDDEEPIYDDIADDEEPIYDDTSSTAVIEEYDTARSGTQGDQSVKHRIESFEVNHNYMKPNITLKLYL